MAGPLLLADRIPAQPAPGSPTVISRYSVRVWQTDEGLPQNSVHAIAQTADGYLWVGTREGLARFDGVRFTTVENAAAPHLKDAWITALCVSRDGSLWIATDSNGVTRLQAGKVSNFTDTNGLPSNQTRCLAEDRDGNIWIGSEDGLTRFRDGQFKTFTDQDGLTDNSVRAVCEDSQGIIRVATRSGLDSLNRDGRFSLGNFGLGTITNRLKSVCPDRAGRLWLGAVDGLIRLQGPERAYYGVTAGLQDRIVTSVFEDHRGQLWIGTYGGLARMVAGQVVTKPLEAAAIGDLINVVFEDHEENLWVGGRDGLYRLNPTRLVNYTTRQGLNCNNVMSVCEDRSGTIWLATWGGGVDQINDGKITSISSTNGLTQDTVLSLAEARDGSLWIGMDFSGGLNRLSGSRSNSFHRRPDLLNAAVRVIHEDRHGALWIGTSRGLNILRDEVVSTYTIRNGLAGNTVMAICETREGKIWVGTDGGLSGWDGSSFTNFTTRQGMSSDAVNALYEDPDGTLWIGTKNGGLNRFRDGRFTAYTTRQGLFSDEIYEILDDGLGYFWLSCRRGIFRVSRAELDALDRGTITSLSSTVLGRMDGLVSVQCNGVSKPAGWRSRDGRLWFPTIRGVVALEPGIQINTNQPPVAIEEVKADGKLLRADAPFPSAKLVVPPGPGNLEIHYTGLSFQAPEKVRFKYRLTGIDSDWVDAGAQRSASYNNVQPGQYRFQVAACNNDGVWNQAGAELAIQVLPRYWQTWWFKVATAAVAVGLLSALYRSRVARLREIERLRVQIASDLHDDVGSRLTKVAMVTETMDRATPVADRSKPHIANISRTVREITRAMDEIVWTINPVNDTLDNLANYVFQYAQEYFQNTNVRCRLDVPAELPDHPISTEDRHNLFMAVKEAFNNILKHAGASEVRLGLTVAGNLLTIVITDNGRGIAPDQAGAGGDGLANMKRRLQQIGGRLDVQSAPGTGTTITMEARGRWSA